MRRLTYLVVLLLGAQTALAQSPQYREKEDLYQGVKLIRGTVIGGYRVDPSEDIDTGFGVDINYTSVAVNIGASSKKFGDSPIRPSSRNEPEDEAADERVNNVYAGIGFSRLLQLQYGYGNHGNVVRLRSDFNFRSISSLLSNTHYPKDRMTLADRITFIFAAERYNDSGEEIFDNFTWGIGLLF